MSIHRAEELKREWTDQYVVVSDTIPELKRFAKLTGRVKTVNMNGRALVEFDGPEDISWYDIAPDFLTVVDAPQPKAKAEPKAKPAAAKTPAETAKPAAAESGKKLSPLELARQQGAGGGGEPAAAKTPAETAKPAAPASGKKLSPLEMARQQDAGGGGAPAAAKTEAEPAKPAAPASGKKLSPLEMARQQDAGGGAGDAETPVPPAESAAEEPAAAAEEPAETSSGDSGSGDFVPTPGDTASIIALAREQGGFQG